MLPIQVMFVVKFRDPTLPVGHYPTMSPRTNVAPDPKTYPSVAHGEH